jgi:hypothetical protein
MQGHGSLEGRANARNLYGSSGFGMVASAPVVGFIWADQVFEKFASTGAPETFYTASS